MKKAIKYKALGATITLILFALIAGIVHGINKSEQNECRKWAQMADERPDFYITDWQRAQCEHWGIPVEKKQPRGKIEATRSVKRYYDGTASWYDYALGHEDQKCTPDREPCYSQQNDTCASRDYDRGTMLVVTTDSKKVVCRVNDYGPADTTRIIDLSSHAFAQLAPLSAGLITVTVQEQ